MHDVKGTSTYWLSIDFTYVFSSENMCKREEFSKLGFVWSCKTYGFFSIGTYLQLSNKTKQIPGI